MQELSKPPTERAPFVRIFGDLAPRVAQILRADPALAIRLTFAPREAIHSIGAYLHLAADPEASPADLAAKIAATHPRDLLREALPDCPARLYRALDRAGDQVLQRRFYERLGAVCRGPYGERFLRSGSVGPYRVDFYEKLELMHPITQRLAVAMPEETSLLQCLDTMVRLLRARMLLSDADVHLDKKAGVAAVARLVTYAADHLRAPEPPFSIPPYLRLIRTGKELREHGKRLGNCISSFRGFGSNHLFRLAEGSTVYMASDEPAYMVALTRAGPGLWWLEEARGAGHEILTYEDNAKLMQSLRDAGVTVVPEEPSQAFSRIIGRSIDARHPLLEDFGDEMAGDNDYEIRIA